MEYLLLTTIILTFKLIYMKIRFLPLLLLLTIAVSAHAQLNKGTWLLGGDLMFGNVADKNDKVDTLLAKSSYVYLTPRIGWFVSNKLVIGLSPTYQHNYSNYKGNNSYEYRLSTFSIAPFIRYYQALSEKWAFSAEFNGMNINFSSSKQENYYAPKVVEYTSQGYQLGIFIRPGITYFISSKVGIEASFGSLGYGFSHMRKTTKETETSPELETVTNSSYGGLNLNSLVNALALGIHIYLPGK
jgi:hypothetical protein